ncbi:MAG: adenosylcobinamide amidohydrolase, partial [Ignisphaera sp.]
DLEKEYNVLSTAGCPKIYNDVRYIVFRRVPKDFEYVDLDGYCKDTAKSVGIDYEKSTIFLTAVDVREYGHATHIFRDVIAEVYVTFGVDKPSCIDANIPSNAMAVGTINVAVIVNKPLDEVGLLDLYRLVSEVKGLAMGLAGPMCLTAPSIGTASDATMVAAPQGGERFGGIATDVGFTAAVATLKALSKFVVGTNCIEYFVNSVGLRSIDDILKIAVKAYNKAPIPMLSSGEVEKILRREFEDVFKDPNICIVVRGARLAEMLMALNLFPGISEEEYRVDTPKIIADELIGKAIAEYVNGFKGLLAYYWIERLKEEGVFEELENLPPMTDDIVAAVVGSVLSRVYDKYLNSH